MQRRPILTLTALAALTLCLGTGTAQAQTDIPRHVQRLYDKLVGQVPPPESDSLPQTLRAPRTALTLVLPQTRQTIAGVLATAPTALRGPLEAADQSFDQAWELLHKTGNSGRLDFVADVLAAMAQGQGHLDQALDIAAVVDPGATALLLPAVQKVREAARRITVTMVEQAQRAGVSAERLVPAQQAIDAGDRLFDGGDYGGGGQQYAQGFGLAANTTVFSLDRFEQNLRSVFNNESVGWSYAISLSGQLARSGAKGLARTAADGPQVAQSPNRKMHVASVSKTMTSIVLLRLLHERGISVDAPIGPYLPAAWSRGNGVNAITFRQLMTHRSGFGQNAPGGNTYAALEAMVAQAVPERGEFDYENANFGLVRVLVSVLRGLDPTQFAGDRGAISAAAFIDRAQTQFANIGVPFSCDPSPVNPTLQYRFPDPGSPGYSEPPSGLACGGFGTFFSATDLVRTLAYLRYTTELLPATQFQQMKSGFLGFMDPANKYGFAESSFGGVYHTHGGDWDHAQGGLDSCVMMYPIHLEAAVLVNSSRKASGTKYSHGGYQCSAMKWAYENAWVAQ